MNAATKAVINWADGSTEQWYNDLLDIADSGLSVYDTASAIKNYVMNVMLAEVEFGSFAGELVKLSMDDINFNELADHYIGCVA